MKNILFIFLILFSVPAFAQEGELPDEQIIIQKDKKIVLPELAKPAEKVTLSLKPLPKINQKYSYREFSLSLPLLNPKPAAPSLRPEAESPVGEGYVRLGGGNYASTLFDGFYNSGRRKDYSYEVFARHLASASGPVSHSGFSNNELGARAKYFTNAFNLSGGLAYKRDRYNFYGFDRDVFPSRGNDSTRQVFQNIWFQLNLERNKKNSPLHYNVGLGLGNISDRFKASESEASLDITGKYRLSDSSSVGLFSDFMLAKRADSADQNRSLIRFQPHFRFGLKGFWFEAGFQLAVANEPVLNEAGRTGSNKASLHLFPQLRLGQTLIKDKLSAYAGLGGGMQKRTLRTGLGVNPFLAPDVHLRFENQRYSIYAGLRGNSGGRFSYHSQFMYESLNNQAFMINNPGRQEQFLLVYDSSATGRITWETEAVFDLNAQTRAGIRFMLFGYQVKSLEKPWHAPGSMISCFGRYALNEKITLSGEFYYMGGMRALNSQSLESESLKALADLNVKGEYFFKKRYSGFVSVHNLLNNRNERFLYYPTQGFRIMLGASAAF